MQLEVILMTMTMPTSFLTTMLVMPFVCMALLRPSLVRAGIILITKRMLLISHKFSMTPPSKKRKII